MAFHVFIGKDSAWYFWRHKSAFPGITLQPSDVTITDTDGFSSGAIYFFEDLPAGLFPKPIHVLVPDSAHRRPSRDFICHSVANVPPGSFLKLTDQVYISSPVFSFTQIARSYSFIDLLFEAMECCGTYDTVARRCGTPSGTPIFSTRDLLAFSKKARLLHGSRKVADCAQYTVDHSSSPEESALVLALTLPRRLGGFALPKPILGHTLELHRKALFTYGKEKMVIDLYWPSVPLALQFEGSEHEGRDGFPKTDPSRDDALAVLGIESMRITRAQFKDPQALSQVAKNIARKLGKRTDRRFFSPTAATESLLAHLVAAAEAARTCPCSAPDSCSGAR